MLGQIERKRGELRRREVGDDQDGEEERVIKLAKERRQDEGFAELDSGDGLGTLRILGDVGLDASGPATDLGRGFPRGDPSEPGLGLLLGGLGDQIIGQAAQQAQGDVLAHRDEGDDHGEGGVREHAHQRALIGGRHHRACREMSGEV